MQRVAILTNTPFSATTTPRRLAVRLRLAAAVIALAGIIAAAVLVSPAATAPTERTGTPLFRYVNSGWVSPVENYGANPYVDQLYAFVITNQEQLEAFDDSAIAKRTLGNTTTLGRIEFEDSVLLAAYYVWRPVRGDPLSVAELTIEGNKAAVALELSDDPQGREYPYLFAPMTMVAVPRALFPPGQEVEFVFSLNGELIHSVSAMPN